MTPQPDPARIEAIARRMWVPIPSPPKPKAKPQASWATLKPGQHLALREGWFDGSRQHAPGSLFEVVEVDSLGMRLARLTGPTDGATLPSSSPSSSRWETRDWGRYWEKVRRPPRRRRKET